MEERERLVHFWFLLSVAVSVFIPVALNPACFEGEILPMQTIEPQQLEEFLAGMLGCPVNVGKKRSVEGCSFGGPSSMLENFAWEYTSDELTQLV